MGFMTRLHSSDITILTFEITILFISSKVTGIGLKKEVYHEEINCMYFNTLC